MTNVVELIQQNVPYKNQADISLENFPYEIFTEFEKSNLKQAMQRANNLPNTNNTKSKHNYQINCTKLKL